MLTDEEAQSIAARWFVYGDAPVLAQEMARSYCLRYGGCTEVILAAYAEAAKKGSQK